MDYDLCIIRSRTFLLYPSWNECKLAPHMLIDSMVVVVSRFATNLRRIWAQRTYVLPCFVAAAQLTIAFQSAHLSPRFLIQLEQTLALSPRTKYRLSGKWSAHTTTHRTGKFVMRQWKRLRQRRNDAKLTTMQHKHRGEIQCVNSVETNQTHKILVLPCHRKIENNSQRNWCAKIVYYLLFVSPIVDPSFENKLFVFISVHFRVSRFLVRQFFKFARMRAS